MDWLGTIVAAGISGVLALAGAALQHASPRELRRARQLSVELEAMEPKGPTARFARAARDDLVVSWALRTVVTPWSPSRALTFALLGAAITIAVIAIVPLIFGVVATARGEDDTVATWLSLMLVGAAALLMLLALIPARMNDRKIKDLRRRFRDAWGLPNELAMSSFTAELPMPPRQRVRGLAARRRVDGLNPSRGIPQ